MPFGKIGITICEDMWVASPRRQGFVEARQNMLVFDGGNMVACGGDIVFRSERWKPVVCFYDLDINSIRQKNTTWRNDHRHLEKECYVRKLFFRNIYKWLQSPQAVHLSDVDLDHERALQIPVVQS